MGGRKMDKVKLIIRTSVILTAFLITFIFLQYKGVRDEVLYNRDKGPKSLGSILELEIESSSGVISSVERENFYWTHDDSIDYGETPKTYITGFKFDENGITQPQKVVLDGVMNVDWEDIAKDKSGNLIIGDIGSNIVRKDFILYRFKEPKKGQKLIKKEEIENIVFRFPGGEEYNNEALFYGDNGFYILTKEYGKTKMYRLPESKIDTRRVNIVDYIGEFEFLGNSKLASLMDAVTGADISEDGLTMAFNTYKGIYLFKRDKKNTNFFDGEVYYLPLKWDFRKFQYEAITFIDKGKKLLLTSEQGEIYKVKIDDFQLMREGQPTEVFVEEEVEVGGDRQGIIYKIKHVIYLFQVMVMDIIFR
jgi:hypothetical protein